MDSAILVETSKQGYLETTSVTLTTTIKECVAGSIFCS